MKKLLLIFGILLLIGCVSAWTIEGSDYSGTINFFADGTAVAAVDGYPTAEFEWHPMAVQPIGKYLYEATYLWHRIQFAYDPTLKVITSPQFPGARLV